MECVSSTASPSPSPAQEGLDGVCELHGPPPLPAQPSHLQEGLDGVRELRHRGGLRLHGGHGPQPQVLLLDRAAAPLTALTLAATLVDLDQKQPAGAPGVCRGGEGGGQGARSSAAGFGLRLPLNLNNF